MKRFLLRTLLYLAPFLGLLAYYLLFVDPAAMRGDLGRMSQTQFHYTAPALDPEALLSPCRDVVADEIAPLADDELVVFGDSFTGENARLWPDCRWHQFMGGRLGKRIVVVTNHSQPLSEYLSLLTYMPETLGDTVVIECGERSLVYCLCYLDFNQPAPPTTRQPSSPRNWKDRLNSNLRRPLQYYQRRIGIDAPVLTAPLDRAVFSCRSQRLYYYKDDLLEHSQWEIATAAAHLLRLDSISRDKGITLFLMSIPDKYTVYHRYIPGNADAPRLLEPPTAFDAFPRFVNTLPLLSRMVEEGTLDVYLPDDTHFSIPTAQAVGEYMAAQLTVRP